MKLKIIYETETGTTQYVAEEMQKHLKALGHEADLHSVRVQGFTPDITGYDAVLFGAPTYEDGQLERTMKVFITRTKWDLSKHIVGVFGLGNSSYPQFCVAADVLEEWVKQNQGKVTGQILRIDGFPEDIRPILAWVEQVAGAAK
jgi:flavodoxin I